MIELVWDQQRAGTATAASGRSITVGEDAEFQPAELLATSVASCLMCACVKLAAEAGVDLLSFTATAQLITDVTLPAPLIDVRARMVTSDGVPEARVLVLWNQALRQSAVAHLLGERLRAEIEVTRLSAAAPPGKKKR
ncbi:MAG: OsmC family protein [Acidobacteria bacterium]|nr:OsmC family protein [Acidobacteriota bacterium]